MSNATFKRRSFKDLEYTKDRLERRINDLEFELSHKTQQLEKRQMFGILLLVAALLIGAAVGATIRI